MVFGRVAIWGALFLVLPVIAVPECRLKISVSPPDSLAPLVRQLIRHFETAPGLGHFRAGARKRAPHTATLNFE